MGDKFSSQYKENPRNKDGERDLYRQMLVVAIKDSISSCNKKYSKLNRKNAINWFAIKGQEGFSFEKVIEFIFGDGIESEVLRKKIQELIEKMKVTGVKNLEKVFEEMANVSQFEKD